MPLGKYSHKIKEKYVKTMPKLNDEELVMVFKKGSKKITNQIMQRWEEPYMRELARHAASKGGHVLEVGFGMGISAEFIQNEKGVESHTIIECHPNMIAHAKNKFLKQLRLGRFKIIEDFWENAVKKLPNKSFNGILFDSCPLDKEVEFFQFFPFFKEAYRLLKDNGVFTYFSDEPHGISEKHLSQLKQVGFKNVTFEICNVKPTKGCLYWQHETIVVPIIRKN